MLDDCLEGDDMADDSEDVIRMDADIFERIQGVIVEHLRELEDKLYVATNRQCLKDEIDKIRNLMTTGSALDW